MIVAAGVAATALLGCRFAPDLPVFAAAIGVTPHSMASVTMWKIGPECATQQAQWVSAIAANCGEREAVAEHIEALSERSPFKKPV
jgi:hypothetical protein